MFSLFECRVEGLVHYSNLIEFVRENASSASYDYIEQSMKQIILNKEAFEEQNLRRWFKKIDIDGRGYFTPDQLVSFLEEYDLQGPNIIAAIYAAMDRDGTGVTYANFVLWLKFDSRSTNVMYGVLSIAELQKKAYAYLIAVANKGGSNALEEIAQSYLVYDWRVPSRGKITKSEFITATRRAGFVFTSSELRTLASEVLVNDGCGRVSYRKFLAWGTPESNQETGFLMKDASMSTSAQSKKSAGTIMRFLERALQRGVDLLSVFGRL